MEDDIQPGWPLTDAAVRSLIAADESRLLEIKREWYDLRQVSAKAEMVRDLLALANSAYLDAPAILVVGVEDRKHGGAIVGLKGPIDLDQMVQVYSSYATPCPDFRLARHEVSGVRVDLIGVFATPTRPYYATRDLEPSLTSNVFYIRRSSVIGRMTAPEILTILASDAQLRGERHSAEEVLLVGFVEKGAWNGPHGPIVRVANLTDAQLTDVELVFDVRLSRDPASRTRVRGFGPRAFGARESREAELDLQAGSFYVGAKRIGGWDASQQDKWLDVSARVRFRDAYGMLKEVAASTYVLD